MSFEDYLESKADPNVDKYWKLRAFDSEHNADLERYTFKGNIEQVILNAIPISFEVEEVGRATLYGLSNLKGDEKDFLRTIHGYTKNNYLLWIEEVDEPILI